MWHHDTRVSTTLQHIWWHWTEHNTWWNSLDIRYTKRNVETFLHTLIVHAYLQCCHWVRNTTWHRNIWDVVTCDIINDNVHTQKWRVTGASQTCTQNQFAQLNFYHVHIVHSLDIIVATEETACCGRDVSQTLKLWHLKTQKVKQSRWPLLTANDRHAEGQDRCLATDMRHSGSAGRTLCCCHFDADNGTSTHWSMGTRRMLKCWP